MRITAGTVLMSLVVFVGAGRAATEGVHPPNVLLILSDDQGYGDLRLHGNDQIDTPVLDKLAAQGAQFDHFYVSPVCAPTRAALMTGRYFLRTGVVAVVPDYKATMRREEVTLGEVFQQAGYATGLFGKWHLGKWHPYLPNPQGFDEYVGFRSGATGNYFDATLEHNGQNLQTKGYITDALTDQVMEFMRRHRHAPFFCYVPYNVPHQPLQVPERYLKKYVAHGLDVNVAAVYGMIENMDENVGRLLAKLDELGLANNTIVLFLSDNGPDGGRRYNAGMRGGKGGCDEGGVRVPLFVRWPAHIAPGTRVAQLAADIDVLPTLVELCGIPMPKTLRLDGRSLAPLALGRDVPWPPRNLFSIRMDGDHDKPPRVLSGAVRTDRWRLVVSSSKPRLYNMIVDPGQALDVAAQHPDAVETLRAAYDAWYADVTAGGFERVPIPIGYEAEPVVVLESPDSHLEGNVSVKGKVNWDIYWIHSWRDVNDHAWWDVEVVQGGRYAVSMTYSQPQDAAPLTVRVEAGTDAVSGVLNEPAASNSANGQRRNEVAAEKSNAAKPQTAQLGRLDLPLGRCRITFRVRSQPDPRFRFNSLRLERLQK